MARPFGRAVAMRTYETTPSDLGRALAGSERRGSSALRTQLRVAGGKNGDRPTSCISADAAAAALTHATCRAATTTCSSAGTLRSKRVWWWCQRSAGKRVNGGAHLIPLHPLRAFSRGEGLSCPARELLSTPRYQKAALTPEMCSIVFSFSTALQMYVAGGNHYIRSDQSALCGGARTASTSVFAASGAVFAAAK